MIYKLLKLTLQPILQHVLMMILVRVLLKVQAHTRQQEIVQNGNLWNTAKNDLTEQSGLSCFALRMADFPVGAFQVIQCLITICSNTFNSVPM